MKCKCLVTNYGLRIKYCPLHKSAPDLIGAIKLAITYLEDGAPNTALNRLEQAISRVGGRK